MTIKAQLLKHLIGWNGDARLYRLSEPVPYGEEGEEGKTDHVIVSAVIAPYSGAETFIFPASGSDDPRGFVISYGEMDGSYRGGLDHAEAIRNAGWELEP